MAIQDDNTILNKGDLKAYHEAIAPMLGGTLLSRTNVSEHYSTDEKIVGIWTDGKPLYQKTIFYNLTNKVSSAYYETIIDNTITASNSRVVSATGGTYMGDSYKQFNVLPQVSGGINNRSYAIDVISTGVRFTLYESNPSVYSNYSSVVATIQYTKTTDAAGSATTTPGAYDINFPNTWKENTEIYFGNGVYGKRFTGTITAAVDTRVNTTLGTAGINLVSYGGYIAHNNDGDTLHLGYSQGDNNYCASFYCEKSNNSVHLSTKTGSIRTNAPYDIWVTYTK